MQRACGAEQVVGARVRARGGSWWVGGGWDQGQLHGQGQEPAAPPNACQQETSLWGCRRWQVRWGGPWARGNGKGGKGVCLPAAPAAHTPSALHTHTRARAAHGNEAATAAVHLQHVRAHAHDAVCALHDKTACGARASLPTHPPTRAAVVNVYAARRRAHQRQRGVDLVEPAWKGGGGGGQPGRWGGLVAG